MARTVVDTAAPTATVIARPTPTSPPRPMAGQGSASTLPSNAQANGASSAPSISADGRFVAFCSEASNLVPGDTNGASDVFVRDRLTGHTERVSVSSDGAQGDYSSDSPAISADGRFVAFSSYASNFAADDRAGHRDIFVRDRLQGTTRQLSVSSSSAQGNEDSFSPDISADGRYVSFLSNASNLLPDDGPSPDVFVCDLQAGTLERAGTGTVLASKGSGCLANAISADGRWIAFAALHAQGQGTADGPFASDIYVHDRVAGATVQITLDAGGQASAGPSGSPSISEDGRWVAYMSEATNLVPDIPSGSTGISVFLYEKASSHTRWVSELGPSLGGNIIGVRLLDLAPDGRWLAFGFGDVDVYNRETGEIDRVSVAADGGVARGGGSMEPSISADGRYVAFTSGAANLVAGDTNGVNDIFVRDRLADTTERVSVASR